MKRMSPLLRLTIAGVAALFAVSAHAVPIFNSGPAPAGIDDLLIGGTLYDVTFNLVSVGNAGFHIYDDGINGNVPLPVFPFDQSGAEAARDAIVAFLDGGFEEDLTGLNGNGNFQKFLIPFQIAIHPTTGLAISTQYSSAVGQQNHTQVWSALANANFSNLQTHSLIWTTFSPTSSVPEPATFFLLGSGLLGLAFRHKKAT